MCRKTVSLIRYETEAELAYISIWNTRMFAFPISIHVLDIQENNMQASANVLACEETSVQTITWPKS